MKKILSGILLAAITTTGAIANEVKSGDSHNVKVVNGKL